VAVILLAKYASFFAVMLTLWFARIDGTISPFAIGTLFASVFLPLNKFVMAGGTFILSMFVGFEQEFVIANAFAVGVFCLYAIIFLKKREVLEKKGLDIWATVGAFAISQALSVYFSHAGGQENEELFKAIMSVLIGGLFVFCCVIIFKTAKLRRGRIPWTIDQKVCLSVFVVIFALGLGGLESDYFSIHKFVTILIILCGVYWFSPSNTLIVAICMGLGRSFLALNLNFVAIYVLLCIVVMGFRARHPYYSCIALIVMDIVLGTYFDAYIIYNFYSLIPLFLAIAVFLLFPEKWLSFIDFEANRLGINLLGKNTINKNREGIYNRMTNLSNVFAEMGTIYRGMVNMSPTNEHAARLISDHIEASMCNQCPNRPSCHTSIADKGAMNDAMKTFVQSGLARGAVTFMDAPNILSMRCGRLNALIAAVNTLIEQAAEQQRKSREGDANKILISRLLDGISKLCGSFAKEVLGDIVFDNDKAELVKEELLYLGVVCSDAIITRNIEGQYTIGLVVSNESFNDKSHKVVEETISKSCAHKMQIEQVQAAQTSGFSIVTIKSAPKYAIMFGVAQVAKGLNAMNGDSYSVLKINAEKTMMAVCDGMGAGASAKRASTLALSLIENFYKASFPSEIILSTVNQLLTMTGGEGFCALDIAVFNLAKGDVDIIKLGAVDGFIKRAREVEVIEAGSLPIGILDTAPPKIASALLLPGDYVVLFSDGILDAFAGDRVGLGNFINNVPINAAQELSDEIMKEALNRGGKRTSDDCTVVVAKLVDR